MYMHKHNGGKHCPFSIRLRTEVGIRRRQLTNFITMMKELHTPFQLRPSYGIGFIITVMGWGYYNTPLDTAVYLRDAWGVQPIAIAILFTLCGAAIALSRMRGVVAYLGVIFSVIGYTIFFWVYALAGGHAPRTLLGIAILASWLLWLRIEPSEWLGRLGIRLSFDVRQKAQGWLL